MSMYPTKAPHQQGARDPLQVAPNAALLIDFDNVTMGMRSDLSKELKTLLSSDIIKGKVTVQRAYADWRRYPQYIVPLSEASIDLIFAPAYGSNKKNATDIRMAIDGIELVFIRPEIGTFILLTGDSDFSSLVLKLKEYGKYVIGVGIQESSSDILVQNCDEYYSYTSLSGLRKTTDSDRQAIDPWVLVERAVEQMANDDDVMRSDRLKQVMVELDPGFDEGEYGFSKFSRFLTEAAGKGLLSIRKLENGQYEVGPGGRKAGGREPGEEPPRSEERRSRGGSERRRGRGEERRERAPVAEREEPREAEAERPVAERPAAERPTPERAAGAQEPLHAAYELLRRALERLAADGRDSVRDSDVKRKMLELEPGFDETNLGFSKFSRFLRQAHDHEVVDLHKQDNGNYEVSLRGEGGARTTAEPEEPAPVATTHAPPPPPAPPVAEPRESALVALGRRFGFLLGTPKRPAEPVPQVTRAPEPPPPPPAPQERPQRRSDSPRERDRERGRQPNPQERSPVLRADRVEREQQRRFHEAELAREHPGGDGAGGGASGGEAGPGTREREPRRGRGQRGEGRSRRGRGEGRGDGRGDGRSERGEGRSRRDGEGRSRGRSGRPRRERTSADAGAETQSGDATGSEAPAEREVAMPEAGMEREAPRAWDAPEVSDGGREDVREAPEDRESRAQGYEERSAEPVWMAPPPPPVASEPPRAAAPPAAEPMPTQPSEPAKEPGEFDGLEPSRLHTRTKRRGPRR